jgi:hypothetical protein
MWHPNAIATDRKGEAMSKQPKVRVEATGKNIFVFVDGVKVAKRGHPGTAQAGTWVSLEPGYAVFSNADHSEITITHNGEAVTVQ